MVKIDSAPAEGALSMSAALAALVEVGRQAAADQVLAESYTAMAAERTDEDCAAMRGRVSRRGTE